MPKDKPPLAETQIESDLAAGSPKGPPTTRPPPRRSTFDTDHPPVYHAPPVLTALDYSPDGTLLAVRAITKCCSAQGRRLGSSSPGWSGFRSGSNRSRFRRTASGWP